MELTFTIASDEGACIVEALKTFAKRSPISIHFKKPPLGDIAEGLRQ